MAVRVQTPIRARFATLSMPGWRNKVTGLGNLIMVVGNLIPK